jgi:hypothetical protein
VALKKLEVPPELRELERAAREWSRPAPREDRDQSTLKLRLVRPFLEALWNLALFDTDKRRRAERVRKAPLTKVAIWSQASQARLRAAYRRHTRHERDPHDVPPRTMSRRVNALKRRKFVAVISPRYFDTRQQKWVVDANVYVITYRGKLWIKRNAIASRIPLVV